MLTAPAPPGGIVVVRGLPMTSTATVLVAPSAVSVTTQRPGGDTIDLRLDACRRPGGDDEVRRERDAVADRVDDHLPLLAGSWPAMVLLTSSWPGRSP